MHDIGHAPYSHAFETCVWNRLFPSVQWNHEDQSAKIIDRMIDDLYLDNLNANHVKAIIHGDVISDKPYIFQIVANKHHGIDVDKLDYLQRDSYYTVGDIQKNSFNMILKKTRVIDGNICYSSDIVDSINDVFQTRLKLWNKVYTQSKVKSIEYMMA